MWLDLTTSHRQTWLFSSTSTYHSTDFVTARGVAHLVVHRTSGWTNETIPRVPLETSGGVLSTVDMVVQRRDGPRWLRDLDDDDDDNIPVTNFTVAGRLLAVLQFPALSERDGSASLCMWHVRTLNRISIGSLGRRSDRPVIGGDLVDALVPAS